MMPAAKARGAVPGRPGTPPDRPSRARIFNYWLGGWNHTAADRAEAAELERVNPGARRMMAGNRLFAARATGFAVQDVSQVIDLSCGFPGPENTHKVARGVRPGCAVAYVDDDPEVTDNWDVLFGDQRPQGVAVACADFADPDAVLGDPALKAVIDPSAPVFLLLALALNIMPPGDAADLVAGYAERIAPGSIIAISCPRVDDPAMAGRLAGAWRPSPEGWNFSHDEFAALFDGLELVPPGIAPAASLRPGWEHVPCKPPGAAYVIAGIGRRT